MNIIVSYSFVMFMKSSVLYHVSSLSFYHLIKFSTMLVKIKQFSAAESPYGC